MDEKIEDLDDTEVSDFLGIFEYQVTNQKYIAKVTNTDVYLLFFIFLLVNSYN